MRKTSVVVIGMFIFIMNATQALACGKKCTPKACRCSGMSKGSGGGTPRLDQHDRDIDSIKRFIAYQKQYNEVNTQTLTMLHDKTKNLENEVTDLWTQTDQNTGDIDELYRIQQEQYAMLNNPDVGTRKVKQRRNWSFGVNTPFVGFSVASSAPETPAIAPDIYSGGGYWFGNSLWSLPNGRGQCLQRGGGGNRCSGGNRRGGGNNYRQPTYQQPRPRVVPGYRNQPKVTPGRRGSPQPHWDGGGNTSTINSGRNGGPQGHWNGGR